MNFRKLTTALIVLLTLVIAQRSFANSFCEVESSSDITAQTVDDRIRIMIPQLRPKSYEVSVSTYVDPICIMSGEVASNLPCFPSQGDKDISYTIDDLVDGDDTRSLYDRLVMTDKPELADFTAHLTAWKNKLVARITLATRICSVAHLEEAMGRCGYSYTNKVSIYWHLSNEKNTTKLECLESKESEIDSDISAGGATATAINTAEAKHLAVNCSDIADAATSALCITNN